MAWLGSGRGLKELGSDVEVGACGRTENIYDSPRSLFCPRLPLSAPGILHYHKPLIRISLLKTALLGPHRSSCPEIVLAADKILRVLSPESTGPSLTPIRCVLCSWSR